MTRLSSALRALAPSLAPSLATALPLAAALTAAPPAPAAAAEVVLINPFTVPAGREAEALEAWTAARAFLSRQPGYISTRLHAALDPKADYALVNVARWESPEAFRAAIIAMRAAGAFPTIPGVVPHPALYRVAAED